MKASLRGSGPIVFAVCVTVVLIAAVLAVRAYAKPRWHSSIATTFHDSRLACHRYSGYIVANLSLPCGTRVKFCYHGCAWARVADRGPYANGATWDLDTDLARAIGFPDSVLPVNWRRAAR